MSTARHKYPRTPHLPWSRSVAADDVVHAALQCFAGQEVIVTEKLDGENTTMYRDHIHARSIDSRHHASRNWVKALHGEIAHHIPAAWRLCGENMYARHSLAYDDLESYFYLFSVFDGQNVCLSWDETCEWARLLGLVTPREFYRGDWDLDTVLGIEVDTDAVEGYVVRTTAGFPYDAFEHHVAKWVRTNHVQTDEHWMYAEIVPNRLKEPS